MSPLFPDVAEQLRVAADRLPSNAEQHTTAPRRRWLLTAGAAAALATVVVAAASVLPSNTPTPANLLTPQDAVAGALASLDSDGILEWTDRQRDATHRKGQPASGGASTTITRWIDLKTGDGSVINAERFTKPSGEHRVLTATTWNVGHTGWLDEGQVNKTTRKRVVRETIDTTKTASNAAHWTPVARLRRTLQRAEAGKLPIHDDGTIAGIPVVVITDRQKALTERTWVTKERSPRILRSAFTTACHRGWNCSQISDDGSPNGSSTTISETLTWTIHPRTDRPALTHVQAPTFDPAKYEVVIGRTSR